MGGLKNLFLKLTPIMLLICCICYGIIHTFQVPNEANITYLQKEQINIGTTENPQYKELYKFDVVTYAQNIDQNILKRSTTKLIDLQTYQNVLTNFNAIWEDGYQFGDGVQTIINASLLTINTLILPINIVLVPLRIISGLLLTGMSLVGININNGAIITPSLNFIVDSLAIPLLKPTYNPNRNPENGNKYEFKDDMPQKYKENNKTWISPPGAWINHYVDFDLQMNFTSEGGGQYKRLFTEYDAYLSPQDSTMHLRVWYRDTSNNDILVYDNGWIYTDSKFITLTSINTSNDAFMKELQIYLRNATKIN